jgi:hypothetical protein
MLLDLSLRDNVGVTLFDGFFGQSNSTINFDFTTVTAFFGEVKITRVVNFGIGISLRAARRG